MITSKIHELYPKRFTGDCTETFSTTRSRRYSGQLTRSAGITKSKHKGKRLKMRKIWWWNPHLHSFFGDFCNNTSIGGLKFLAKRKLHISERIFWLISFLTGVAVAAYLIIGIFDRYNANPVVVAFASKEKSQHELPFPAVTICNMNKFPKSEYKKLERKARMEVDPSTERNKTFDDSVEEKLLFTKALCEIQESFSKTFNYSHSRGQLSMTTNGSIHGQNKRSSLIAFMYKHTLKCDQILRLCSWGSKIFNCSFLFKRISTDYGRCCSFNMLPTELLYFNSRKHLSWTEEEIDGWKEWKYSENWAVLEDHIKYPRRQIKAGSSSGLTILIDPNTDEYFCPISDSEGFRFTVHSPLERPQISKFGSALAMGKEISVRVTPGVILADPSIKQFEKHKRKCILGNEVKLDMFRPYTKNNCLDECISNIIADNCSCIPYTSASKKMVKMCIEKYDILCINKISYNLYALDQIAVFCGHCISLCENINYVYHLSDAELQDSATLWKNHNTDIKEPEWADHNMSIVHVYFYTDTTIPRLRTRILGFTDLIANTGGVLGLCLGVSIISAIETIYFFTLRILWIKIRRKTMGYRVANIFWVAFQKYKLKVKEKKNRHVTFIDI